MNNTGEFISINKEDYFKTYLTERQNLHIHLVQQLLAKAEVKKQLVLQQAADMVEKFTEYREEFLRNLPPQIKSMTVKDYITKYDCNFQKCLSSLKSEESLQIQNAEKNMNSQSDVQISLTKQSSSETTSAENKPHFQNENQPPSQGQKEDNENEHEVIKLYESKHPFRVLTNKEDHKHFGFSKQNTEIYPPAKSSKKRNRDLYEENALKENRNILNTPSSKIANPQKTPTWSATKVLNAMNKAGNMNAMKPGAYFEKKIINNTPHNTKTLAKIGSPSRKPWMP
jgi:hypothetical protein